MSNLYRTFRMNVENGGRHLYLCEVLKTWCMFSPGFNKSRRCPGARLLPK